MKTITSEQIVEALVAGIAEIHEFHEYGSLTVTVSAFRGADQLRGQFKAFTNIDVSYGDSIEKVIRKERIRHGVNAKTEAEKLRERAAEMLKQAAALEGESLAGSAPEIAEQHT